MDLKLWNQWLVRSLEDVPGFLLYDVSSQREPWEPPDACHSGPCLPADAGGSGASGQPAAAVGGPGVGPPRPWRWPVSSACTPLFPGTSGVSGLPRFTSHVALLPPEASSPPFGPVRLSLSFQTAPRSRRRCLGPQRGDTPSPVFTSDTNGGITAGSLGSRPWHELVCGGHGAVSTRPRHRAT